MTTHERSTIAGWMLLAAVALGGCVHERMPRGAQTGDYGVLVMAHGGSAAWDDDVRAAIAPLDDRYPIEIAFGMADAGSLQDGIAKLEARGVRRIGVVRLFVSAESFLDRTEQILGLRSGAPPRTAAVAQVHDHGGHDMALWRVESGATFALSHEGLSEAPEVGAVLLDRARSLSRDPAREAVLVLAHGPGDDAENARWLEQMDRRADEIRRHLPFARVAVATLREDWPEKREQAERAVRDFVATTRAAGQTPIVIPFRVSGFGPYARVLDGLEYVADGRGLLPHEGVTRWIDRQATELDRLAAPDAAARRY